MLTLKRDGPEAPVKPLDVETIAGNSGELQFRMLRESRALWCMAPALWQLPPATAEPSACGQPLLAQSGAQLGATMRATSVTILKSRSGHVAFRIRLAFVILLLRYALVSVASTVPKAFNRRTRANPCRPQPYPQKTDRRKWNIPSPE